jgi:HEAT repeats
MRAMKTIAAALLLTALPWTSAQAGIGWSVGLNFGGPAYYHPYYGYPYHHYYYRPYPVYVGPSAVIVQPGPYYPAVPVYQPVYSSPAEVVPAPLPPPTPLPTTIQPTGLRQDGVEQQLQTLSSPDDGQRAAAAVQLGRLKAKRAVQPLTQVLSADRSASVREAAARALGLIDDSAALPALQQAAQGDDDRDVRHSAQFAAEGMRAKLPR